MSRLYGILAALWALTCGSFLVDVAGGGIATPFARLVVLVTLLATAAAALWAWGRLWSRDRRPWGPLLAGLVIVAAGIAFLGLDHEVGRGYYDDEGHYVARARRVLAGELFFGSFIYPHLMYYLDGLALWIANLFPEASERLLHRAFRYSDPAARDWMVLRVVGAILGAATMVPAFHLARRVAGPLAAFLAGAATLFAASFHAGYQVNTCDVPSAFFATLTMAVVGRLLERETRRDYVLAGVAAGLAAGAKYPAGVVAVAIVGVWIWHRVRSRDLRPGILWAGMAAITTFLAVVPSLLVHTEAALRGKRGLFFGVRQYGKGGWTGVTPPSNALWYGERLAQDFGLGLLLLAAVGLLATTPRARRLLAGLLPFPVIYLALIATMSMVVIRNAFPVMPTLAVILAAGASGVPTLLARRLPRWRGAATVAVVVVALAAPTSAITRQVASLDRPSTREVMARWIHEHLPRGAGILKETYTPDLDPAWFRTAERRFAVRFPAGRLVDPRFDYLLLASSAHLRFLDPRNEADYQGRWYRKVFSRHRLVHEVRPATLRRGPHLLLYRLEGRSGPPRRERSFTAEEAFLSDGGMAAQGSIRFTRIGQIAVFQDDLVAGRYRLRLDATLPDAATADEVRAELEVRQAEGEPAATRQPLVSGEAVVELPVAERTYLALSLSPGSRLRGLKLSAF